jgi:hypothetical protein
MKLSSRFNLQTKSTRVTSCSLVPMRVGEGSEVLRSCMMSWGDSWQRYAGYALRGRMWGMLTPLCT